MNFDLEYNSDREVMVIPEYGRHIHKLISHCIKMEDRDERNKMANAIIDVMGNLQPHLRDVHDFKHKLWDQLFMMADFKLDVDSPFPITTEEELKEKPSPLPYPKSASKYRYYGHNMQIMIDVAISWEDGDLKEKLTHSIANHMKKCYLLWNKDSVTDAIIKNHLQDLSDNKLTFDFEKNPLISSTILTKSHSRTHQKKKEKSNKNKKYRKQRS